MAQTFEFLGTWDPSTGTFPIVPDTTTSAYYLVAGPGVVGGHTFSEGDWLIYIEGTAGGSWYRTAGGIIQLASDNTPIQLTSADISDFNVATQAAILVDGVTIVKDPQSGALTVIAPCSPSVFEEDDDDSYVAPHTHVSTDITDWINSVRVALGPGRQSQPFFSNTAVSNAVVFTYDTTTNTVSADVKVDNQTIIKNKYGQLVAGKPQPMSITDILGLQAYLDNYVTQFADPALSSLGSSSPTLGPWKPSGAHDFTQVKLGDALYLLNVNVADLKTMIEVVADRVESLGLAVQPPPALNSSIVPILDPEVTFHQAYKSGTGEVVGVIDRRFPGTLPTAKFYKGIEGLSLPNETLEALIDGSSVGRVINLDGGRDQTNEKAGALEIVEDQDSYIDEPAFRNLFRSIRARILPKSNLSTGTHTYQLRQTTAKVNEVTGQTFYSSTTSGTLSFAIDVPATTMGIRSDIAFNPPPPPHFISGVASLDPTFMFNMTPLTAEGVVGYAYGEHVAKFAGKNTLIDFEGDLPAAAIPAAPAPDAYSNAVTAPVSFKLLDEYNENAAISLYPYNSIGVLGPELVWPLGRIDHTIESNRVYSGDPTNRFPAISTAALGCGSTWDASKSLVATPYTGELQKVRKAYQWPNGAYSEVNYTNASGITIPGMPGLWRWVTLKPATDVHGRVAFTLTFTGGNTEDWSSDTYTKSTPGILIYAKLSNSGWVDCNSPYRGVGLADTNGAAAMDVSGYNGYQTTANVKRVTLGPSNANSNPGDLYIRIALPITSTKTFEDVVVSEWA